MEAPAPKFIVAPVINMEPAAVIKFELAVREPADKVKVLQIIALEAVRVKVCPAAL